jgi:YbbR domain-containing protein
LRTNTLLNRIIANWPAKILAVAVAVLLFVFNRINNLQESHLEILLDVILPTGYAIAAPYQEKVSVILKSDDETSIGRIKAEDFWVYIDLSDHKREGEFNLPVRYTRRGPALQPSIFVEKVEPPEIQVAIERELSKSIPVRPVFKGTTQTGYTLSGYSIAPEEVTVRGPRSRVASMDRVLTEEIDLSGRFNDFIVKIDVDIQDPFVTISSNREVEFKGSIEEIILTKDYVDIPIRAENLDNALVWANNEQISNITLEGPKIFIEALDVEDVRMIVDLEGIRDPGEYAVNVIPSVPPGIVIREFYPAQIIVFLRRRDGGTL